MHPWESTSTRFCASLLLSRVFSISHPPTPCISRIDWGSSQRAPLPLRSAWTRPLWRDPHWPGEGSTSWPKLWSNECDYRDRDRKLSWVRVRELTSVKVEADDNKLPDRPSTSPNKCYETRRTSVCVMGEATTQQVKCTRTNVHGCSIEVLLLSSPSLHWHKATSCSPFTPTSTNTRSPLANCYLVTAKSDPLVEDWWTTHWIRNVTQDRCSYLIVRTMWWVTKPWSVTKIRDFSGGLLAPQCNKNKGKDPDARNSPKSSPQKWDEPWVLENFWR